MVKFTRRQLGAAALLAAPAAEAAETPYTGALDGLEAKEITFPVGKTGSRTMTAEAYVKTWALPNLFFHITTAYNILRHNGVAIGKVDFLAGAAA